MRSPVQRSLRNGAERYTPTSLDGDTERLSAFETWKWNLASRDIGPVIRWGRVADLTLKLHVLT
ncbi:hypothetical protein N8642_02070 [bacterium]|nr:hypothetical protein [bacterium]